MTTIALGVFMFTFVIVTLVAFLMVARNKLVATGEVTILVNEDPDKALKTTAGSTLLGTLASNKIFIPSACGGKGSCGVCKVTVTEGGGAMLPTEVSHINRGEEREGVRLACQVKVKGDMDIELPPEVFSVKKWKCSVRLQQECRHLHQGAQTAAPRRRRGSLPGRWLYPDRVPASRGQLQGLRDRRRVP